MRKPYLALLIVFSIPSFVSARLWTDLSGHYKIEADLIAFNDKIVILQRAGHELGQVPIDELSQADREYLKTKEADEAIKKIIGVAQTWNLRNGLKLVGKIVDFARRNMELRRRGGNIYVNDRLFDNLPKIYQIMIPKIVARSAHLVRDDKQALEDWLVAQQGQPQSILVEGVLLEMDNHDEYVVPFFFFSDADQAVLKPGWERWLAANSKQQYDQQDSQAFLLQSMMAARQRDQQIQQEIANVQLNQAILAGATSLWEVSLYPARGNGGAPQWVVMPGLNSGEAVRNALAKYSGYVAGAVRKVAGY